MKKDTILIYDEIGNQGILVKTFIEELNDIKELTAHIRINSAGGSVFEGLAIYNAIKEYKNETIIHIDGLAAGIASIIALASNKRLMHKDAFVMIKTPTVLKLHSGEPAASKDELEKITDTLVKIYVENSNKSEAEIREMIAAETWFNAEESLEVGFVDTIEQKEA